MSHPRISVIWKYNNSPALATSAQGQTRALMGSCAAGLPGVFIVSWLLFLALPLNADTYSLPHTKSSPQALQRHDDSLKTFQGYITSNFDTLRSVTKPLYRDVGIISLNSVETFISLGASAGIDMDIGTFEIESPPHLRVDFLVQTLENLAVSNGGAIQDMRINWSAHSTVATDEPEFKPDSWIPPPGNSLQFNDPPIYIGLVTNGCGNVVTFPITFYSEVYKGGDILGSFSATDNKTIQPNGYWNFSYTIRVSDNNGNQSDVRVKGIVRALCE